MKKVILFLIFFSGLIPYPSFAEEYSLSDLYRLALDRSERIKIAEEDFYISKRDKDRAMAVLIPTLSAFGSYTKYSTEKTAGTFGVIQPDHSTEWGLKLNQSFSVSGRELTALNIAKESIVKSGFDLDSVKEEYLLSVAASYYDVLKARKALDIANANVGRLTKHRDASSTRLRVGEITKTVLLRAEAELSGAQSDLIRAENTLKLARAVLARTVGISGEYDLKEEAVSGQYEAGALESYQQTALSERNELKSVSLQRRIAEQEIKYAKGLYWPNLSVEGAYARKENSPVSDFENRESIYGTVKLDFPFFEGGLRKAEARQAEARFRQADNRLSDLMKSISVEVENAYLALLTEEGILEKLRAEREYAEDNYNAVTKQFQYGLADSIDVIDANTLLVTSERELANAQYDYQYAVLSLKRATGTLLKTVLGRLPEDASEDTDINR